jgi:UDP-N-acetylmuramoyl-tripeptide--D-alanyl-D-alanine ligase
MKKIYVQDVLEKTKGEVLCGNADKEIEEISIDTRTLKHGQTYLALKGENVDGIIFCRDAIQKGATVCFIQENIFTEEELSNLGKKVTIVKVPNVEDALVEMAKIKRSLYNIPVVGITGSVGKTSTKDVIASVMEQKFNLQKTQGNQNNRLGLPLTIMGLKDHDALVVEMGMNHFGEMRELTQIAKPSICVISNIGTSHIGNLGSRENILKAKLEVLEGMENGKIIINNDNDLLHKWNLEDKKEIKITFGINEKSDYIAKNINMKEDGNEFTVEINSQEYKFTTKKAGEPFILNALSAIAVGMEFAIPIEKIQKGIAEVNLSKNRMDIEKINDVLIVKDYYNASLESIKPSLEYLSKLEGGKKIAVLGDIKEVGDFAKELHEKVGEEVVKNKIDILITVGTDAKYIANKAIEEGMLKENVFAYNTNMQAAKQLNKIAIPGDKVLLKASNSMKFGEIFDGFSKKVKVGIVVGGMSSEHDVSLMSGKSILEKINKEKYEIKVIYIKKNSNVYEYVGEYEKITEPDTSKLKLQKNLIEAVKDCEVIFPVLHGKYGEDGCIQGVFEMIKKPYVGCEVFASGACMDKEFTKKLVSLAGIQVAKSITVQKINHNYLCDLDDTEYTIQELCKKAENDIGYPMFIKPSREGSSFGVTRANSREELKNSIREAERFDNKILIEEEIKGREIECAVLGNENIITSEVGEVKAAESFYTFDAKYNNPESKTITPAKVKPEEREKIKKAAKLAYRAVNCKGLSRVDFFLKENGEVILNEINTLPGFTKISMYPKLFESIGIEYSKLIDILIELAIER